MVSPPLGAPAPHIDCMFFKVLTQALVVWNNNVWLVDVGLFWPGGFGISFVAFVGSYFLVLQFDSIQGPGWILASLQG